MRLIDADAFQEEFKNHLEYALKLLVSNGHKNSAEFVESFGEDIARLIDNAPTVEREVSVPETCLMTIARLLDNEMNQCVEHGANSVSMPDDLVELAVWLSAAPKE